MDEWVVLLHVGRDVTLSRARASPDITLVRELVTNAATFERYAVIPGSFAVLVAGLLAMWAKDIPLTGDGSAWLLASLILYATSIPLIPLVFVPRGRVFEAALDTAAERGEVTPELTAAFNDGAVRAARIFEVVVVGAIVVLMVTKPF
jgi:uncharacterized membrane protein